ncbi:glycoside hydrolase family 3 protein [Aliagarivorans marinus]|uniref:glycoside hydrolase family 3 protein n=1 Tax=Aliagarivorans marinus TaxID=561965 RepID=UPI0004146A25|nr:glycoside hydrolase family 3 protein [Aliagarivorans marinus]
MKDTIPYFNDWPRIESAIQPDPQLEREISQILAQMTLEEKIGQMIQPNLRGVTPELAKQYKLGSILNGGGTWIDENKYATAEQWTERAEAFWQAVDEAYADRPFRIPFMWATDAVHGHNNAFGATLFPHNIGLGCARDPELIERIGQVTAREVAATGLDWTFAPTVAVPRDLRWGRTYEGYAEDPIITYYYAERMVQGLQGDAEQLKTDLKVISNVKHWLGDGGTAQGVDRGDTHYSEELMRNLHGAGYFSGLNAGAQVVMSSFNTWVDETNYDHDPSDGIEYNHKLHGSKYLITDILKTKMGFDGLVVTDWNGHAEVSKCSDSDVRYAINAGNDILMISDQEHWIPAFEKTVADVNAGHIPMARINDAVLRILRVKKRAGLWEKASPKQRRLSAQQANLGAEEHRSVAREAVRKSMVLLKNNEQLLPLAREHKLLLTGSAADDLTKQVGGWNLTWQGDENQPSDFPNGITVRAALEQEMGEQLCFADELPADLSEFETAIVAFGEDPYAEMIGDIKPGQSLDFSQIKRRYTKDCQTIEALKQAGVKVVALFFSGRPLYVNPLLNASDAFIAAFLPGSEGRGISDLLLRDNNGAIRFDFTGKLSFSWPMRPDSYAMHRIPPHIENYQMHPDEQAPKGEHAPLFPYGYGLRYGEQAPRELDNLPHIELEQDDSVLGDLHLYGIAATPGNFDLLVQEAQAFNPVSRNNPLQFSGLSTRPYNCLQQQDSIRCHFSDSSSTLSIMTSDKQPFDLFPWLSHGDLVFDIKAYSTTSAPLWLTMGEGSMKVDIAQQISDAANQSERQFHTQRVSLQSLVSWSQSERTTLLELNSEAACDFVIANVRIEAALDKEQA